MPYALFAKNECHSFVNPSSLGPADYGSGSVRPRRSRSALDTKSAPAHCTDAGYATQCMENGEQEMQHDQGGLLVDALTLQDRISLPLATVVLRHASAHKVNPMQDFRLAALT